MAILLWLSINLLINFDNANSSEALNLQVPFKLHQRYYGVSWVLMVIALVSFSASYFEKKILFQINTICCGVGIAGMVILSLSNQTMSFEISEQFGDGYCSFIMPSFS